MREECRNEIINIQFENFFNSTTHFIFGDITNSGARFVITYPSF